MSAQHAATVQGIYEAFGRGDIDAILDVLDEDVEWESWADNSAQAAGVPWLAPRHGRAGVREFFGIVAKFDISEFTVLDVMAGDRQVAAEIVIEASVPETGGAFRDEELHLWTFGDGDRITRLRHYVDTAKHTAAARGERRLASDAPAPAV